MLSEEEKEAIKELIEIKELSEEELKFDDYEATAILDQSDLKSLIIVLNLIEKQSKEIEELKNGQIDFWISDKEIEERIRNKFVSKDKIKAKIEEYDKLQKEMTFKNHNADNINDCYKYGDKAQKAMYQKEVLQSLLEEDK